MQVIADFDNTLTRSKTEANDRADITYDVFAKSAAKRSPSYDQMFKTLNEKYGPIESNPSLSGEEKSLAMLNWFVHLISFFC